MPVLSDPSTHPLDERPGGDHPADLEPLRAPKAPVGTRSISARILWLTILSVMLAEVLIFVPSIANFRQEWLEAKIQTIAVAGLVSQQSDLNGRSTLDEEQQQGLLRALDANLVGVVEGGASRLLARDPAMPPIDFQVDISEITALQTVLGAFDTLFAGGNRTMRISGAVGDGTVAGELVMSEAPLRRAMLVYSRNIFLLSIGIASFAALLVYAAISINLIRPIQAMTRSMVRFAEKPSDLDRIIVPSGRADEIGIAEAELSGMQAQLAATLREQRHLADLGLAVSKINHDLRNILASAQMISDRLAAMDDPRVQRIAPMLLRSLDRALTYTQSVLDYGRAVENAPVKRQVRLRRLVDDVYELLSMAPASPVEFVNAAEEAVEIEVDPDQFHRVLLNLCRNALQALEASDDDPEAVVRRIVVGAEIGDSGETLVFVEDTGPGLPEMARRNLFKAFKGSARTGGTGLGLAIVAEIVEAHGGRIALADTRAVGTRFEIVLPARSAPARSLGAARTALRGGEQSGAAANANFAGFERLQ